MLLNVEIKDKKDYAKGKIRMALDALYRALGAIDGENLSYVCSQLQRAEQYSHDARFAADLADLLRVHSREESNVNVLPDVQGTKEPAVSNSNTPASR